MHRRDSAKWSGICSAVAPTQQSRIRPRGGRARRRDVIDLGVPSFCPSSLPRDVGLRTDANPGRRYLDDGGGVALMESSRVLCDLRVDARASHAPRLLDPHSSSRFPWPPFPSYRLTCLPPVKAPAHILDLRIGIATLMGLGHALQPMLSALIPSRRLAMKALGPLSSLLGAGCS